MQRLPTHTAVLWDFNTSHVSVQYFKHFLLAKNISYFNTSHVSVQYTVMKDRNFIDVPFQYISCVGSMTNNNTTYINWGVFQYISCVGSIYLLSLPNGNRLYFNTSHVSVQSFIAFSYPLLLTVFQYISCVGSIQLSKRCSKYSTLFQYISCVGSIFCYLEFQTLPFLISIHLMCRFNVTEEAKAKLQKK